MYKLILSLVLIFFLSACMPIKSEKPLISNSGTIFDRSKVYKISINTYDIKNGNVEFSKGMLDGYIEPGSNGEYTVTIYSDNGDGGLDYIPINLLIKEIDRPFSVLSDYYIAAYGSEKFAYFFLEKTKYGSWYSYIPLWDISSPINLTSKKDLHELADKIFSQNRKNAAKEVLILERERDDVDYVYFRKKYLQFFDEIEKNKKAKVSKKEPDKDGLYLSCKFDNQKKEVLVFIDRNENKIKWSDYDRPDEFTGCPLVESESFSSGLCLSDVRPIKLNEPIISPRYDHGSLVTHPVSQLCLMPDNKANRKILENSGRCTAIEWAKRNNISGNNADILSYREIRINRYSLNARLLKGNTVRVYSKNENIYYWTNNHRWQASDNGKCKITEEPRRRI